MLGLGNFISKPSVLGGAVPHVGVFDGINDSVRLTEGVEDVFRDYWRESWTLVFWTRHTNHGTNHSLHGHSYGGDFGYIGVISKNNLRAYMKVAQGGGGSTIFYKARYYNDASDPWVDYPLAGESAPSSWWMYCITVQKNVGSDSTLNFGTGITAEGQDSALVFEPAGTWNATAHAAAPTYYFDLGSYGTSYRHYGNIGKIGFWNVALSQPALNVLYAGGYGGVVPDYRKNSGDYGQADNLQAYLNFEDGIIANVGLDSNLTFSNSGATVTTANNLGL